VKLKTHLLRIAFSQWNFFFNNLWLHFQRHL
jgi:hypothetical protein